MELKNFFAQDLQGNVIPNPTVYLYQPGTTTLATGLQNETGGALTNPFSGNVNGKVTLAAPDGDYDIRVIGAGRDFKMRVRFIDAPQASVTLLREDLSGRGAGQGADMVGYKSGTTVGSALSTLFSANPVRRIPAACKAAFPLFDVTDYQPSDLNAAEAISRVDGHTGVLVQNTAGAYMDILLPYCVGIGDSIMEGHPALHGRLHPTYNPSQGSEPGQLPYELSKHFGLPVINHGWGGQTSVQVRARWPRDVLAQDVVVGDGVPFTMGFAGGKLPYMVYLHVGINDIWTDVPVATIKDNFRFFAQSCRDNKILLVLDNIGPDDDAAFTATRQANAAEVNRWLANEFAVQFPEVYQMDYLHWASGGTNDFRTLRVGCFADDVHPTKAGYAMWAAHVARNLTAPVFMRGLLLNSWLDDISGGPNNFARPTSITIGGDTYTLSSTEAQAIIRLANIDPDEPTYRVTISGTTTITGSGAYTGFAGAYGVLASRYEPSEVEATPGTTTGTWTPVITGLTSSGAVTAVGKYREIEGLIFFDVSISVSGGTTASTGNSTYFTLPFAAKRRAVCVASNAQTANLGTGLIEIGGGGTCFPPTWAASSQTIYISGFYEKL